MKSLQCICLILANEIFYYLGLAHCFYPEVQKKKKKERKYIKKNFFIQL